MFKSTIYFSGRDNVIGLVHGKFPTGPQSQNVKAKAQDIGLVTPTHTLKP